MKSTTAAVDLAKSVFQLAVADASWKVIETHRLARSRFERWFDNRERLPVSWTSNTCAANARSFFPISRRGKTWRTS